MKLLHKIIVESVINTFLKENNDVKCYILKWEYPNNKYQFIGFANITEKELEAYKLHFDNSRAEIEIEAFINVAEFHANCFQLKRNGYKEVKIKINQHNNFS